MQNINNTNQLFTNSINFTNKNTLQIKTFKLIDENGSAYPNVNLPNIDKQTALKIYKTMRNIKLLDTRMQSAQRQGRISFYMQCTGEEAAITASAAALENSDMIMAQYREQAALMYRGFTLEEFMNQMFSNEHDYGKGRQMPVHYGKAALNYMTISSPLATQIPQATGYAYGQKIKGLKSCTICYFGEGAASEGDFHAGLNMAGVLKTPVIFFCRNNGYAISTFTNEQFAGDGIAARGIGYGISTLRVDGGDALAVYDAVKKARELAITKQKPVLIEALAYRQGAHSTSDDPSGYRTKKEEKIYEKKDPVVRFKKWLLQKKWLTEKEDKEQAEQEKADILEALKSAEKKCKPHIDTIIDDVYKHPTKQLQQQLQQLKRHIKKYPENYPLTSKRID